MDRLLTPADVAGILRVSKRTAYKLMQGMARIERPLRVTEESLREWINQKAVIPEAEKKKGHRHKMISNWYIERR